jgi:hypothetical protein
MAAQRLTIAKIGGKAATATLARFHEWNRHRVTEDLKEWSPDQWPTAIRKEADTWAEELRQHGHQPPVLFFAEFVDLWSFCPPFRWLSESGIIQMVADSYELFCLSLPLSKEADETLRRISVEGQHDEDRWFGKFTLEAASAWEGFADTAVIAFLRRVTGGSATDDEIRASMEMVPEWISR